MSQQPPPVPAYPTFTSLELLDSGGVTLFSAPLTNQHSAPVSLNLQTFRAYGVEGQNVQGDGTTLIGEHRYSVLITGDIPTQRKAVLDALKSTAAIRYGTRTQAVARGLGIRSETRLNPKSNEWIFELAVAPSTAGSLDGGSEGTGLV